jgi:putative ABC transport system ATP-binding protein
MNNHQPAVEVRGLVKAFEGGLVRALDGAELTVARGEFVAVVGPSGCGKSTLLHLIAALDRPDEGTIRVNGRDLAQERDLARYRAREVGLVFQLDNLLPTLGASENVQVPMFEADVSAAERRKRARELLTQVGLSKKARNLPTELSGGERQRVAIARALSNNPPILLADEPTGRLDSQSGRMVLDLLQDLRERRGLTVVLVTHEAGVAQRAHRIVRMLDGRIVSEEILADGPSPSMPAQSSQA